MEVGMRTTRFLVVVLVVLVVATMLVGCATYNTRGSMPVISRIEESRLLKAEKDGVEVKAFPILTKEDSEKYFDEDLPNNRILAIFLDISNTNRTSNSNKVKVVSSELRIGETILQPSTADVVYKAIRRGYVLKAWLWTIPTWFVGAIPSVIHTAVVNTKIEEDIKEKGLNFGKAIGPMGATQGFVWFKIPKKAAPEYKSNGLLPKGTILNLILESKQEKIEYKLPMH